jgi:hypothetical protein
MGETASRLLSSCTIETLQRQAAPATVKQHMAAIRMPFSRNILTCIINKISVRRI